MKIKIIKDNPEDGQSSIKDLIGEEFEVQLIHKDMNGKPTGRVSVNSNMYDGYAGLIILNSDEYEVIPETKKTIWQKIAEYTGF